MNIRLTPMIWFVALTLIAIGVALGLPPDPHAVQQLHTTATAYRLAVASLLVPYILIWYASFYAFARLQEYSRPLRKTKDGAAFHAITLGMGTLAFSLVVPTIISLILNSIAAHHPTFKPTAVIISNYVTLFSALISFLLIYNGARMLIHLVRGGVRKFDLRWSAPAFLLLSVAFAHLTIENQYHWHTYHLNIWLLVVTFVVPYLYTWMVGLLAAYDLQIYARTVSGLLYQQAIRQFATGIAITILASVAIQFLDSSIAQRISHSLALVLLVDYGLIATIAVGLILMALGTKKLKRLEEI